MNKLEEKELVAQYENIVKHFKFTYRKQQEDLIINTYRSFFNAPITQFHESPTGTGKSYGYLIPTIEFLKLNPQEKIIISTKTLTLQEQLLKIDIPKLQSYYVDKGYNIKFAVFKGRSNYLCGYRCFKESGKHFSKADIIRIEDWLADPKVMGERSDFLQLGFNAKDWSKVLTEDSRECLKSTCLYFKQPQCCYYRAKKNAESANVIIVNHYLLFTDLWQRGVAPENLIPVEHYTHLIMDEAHLIEDVATKAFTYEFTVDALENMIFSLRHDYMIHNQRLETVLFHAARDLMENLNEIEGDAVPITEHVTEKVKICLRCIADYAMYLKDLLETGLTQKPAEIKIKAIVSKLSDFTNTLTAVLQRTKKFAVHKEKDKIMVTLIDYRELLAGSLFSNMLSFNLLSATLSYHSKFLFPIKSFYIDTLKTPPKLEGFIYPPMFDKNNREFITPKNISDYRTESYEKELADIMKTLILKNNGSALLLFTSLKRMHNVYATLSYDEFPFNILLPSEDIPKIELIKEFKKDITSVLMGSYSFWEGIDVPGESLTLIIIDKLPFETPSVVGDALNEQFGGFNYQCYKTSIKLKQGVGRLIRSETDKGFIVICDLRLYTTWWGKQIYESLNK
jgi:ATP-dependent DNA helicase DinG